MKNKGIYITNKDNSFDEDIQEIIDVIGKDRPENFSGCIELSEYNNNDWEALGKCNIESDKMTFYGLRKENPNQRGTFMYWSNGAKRWFAQKPIDPEDKIRSMDANEMICPISFERAKRIACYIKELPLYYASFEAKSRGDITSREALGIFLEGHGIIDIINKFAPEIQQEIKKEIKEKGWEWFFGIKKKE